MKNLFRKTLSLFLAASLTCSLGLSAAASDALGEDLSSRDILLNQETQLSTNVFWSATYSDLRTENLVTYTPNDDVTPIATFGNTLTERSTVPAVAKELESRGYRVVAGINGDFYNTGTGLPIGLAVSEGRLLSSDGGYYAIGFRRDGTAVLGKPAVKVTANLGYQVDDGTGNPVDMVRQLSGVNKARVSSGGIYLYTYDFNGRHTTGNTEPGIDVVCTIEDGQLSIGDTLTLTVDRVVEASAATAIKPGQVVLSVNLKSSDYYINALRYVPEGAEITLDVTAASDDWNDVEYAVGALYSLVENGSIVSGLPSGANPRTAIGQKADGTLIFYTIDGRKSGHSIGATLNQVAARLIELGCKTALCLDGGGSTTLSVTEPDELEAKTINTPSDGSSRAITNQIFLIASSESTGRLSHFYVNADSNYVLAGSKVNISASAVDTNFIPMAKKYDLEADGGTLEGNVLTTPKQGGDVTVTASSGSKRGETTVHVIETPDSITVRNSSGTIISSLTVAPGTSAALVASAVYNHMALKADQEAFTWTVSGNIGTISESGLFTASAPGTGTITISAGGKTATVDVTVSRLALKTVEDFESANTILSDGYSDGLTLGRTSSSEIVKLGRNSGKLDYTLTDSQGYTAAWHLYQENTLVASPYTCLTMWVYGDGSGNQLNFLYTDGTTGYLTMPVTTLDFTGWKQVTVETGSGFVLQGLQVSAGEPLTYDDGLGNIITEYPIAARTGTLYLDQIVASFGSTVDAAVPTVTLQAEGDTLTGTIYDGVDGVLAKSAVSVTWDGYPQEFTYNTSTGAFSTSLISDGRPHRVTITAKDASGNIGRASYDVPQSEDWTPSFTDTQDYWAAVYVDYLYTSGITTGYEDGTFRPNQNITRAQFSVMLYRYLGLEESKYEDVVLPFADLASIPEYALPAIRALYTEGIINGTSGKDGRLYFTPGNPRTRAQAATMIGRTQEKGYAAAELTFSDAASIPAYAASYIQAMAAQGIISGYTDGTFKPNNNITRGQMAKILYNLM